MANSQIPEAVLTLLKKYDLHNSDNYWQLKHGSKPWIVKHKALEKLAIKEGIVFEMPTMIETDANNKTVSMIVSGKLGKRTEWSVGEASPDNCMNAYPYAMAEKRGKDRVTLKLLGVYGDVMSEDESDDFQQENNLTEAQKIGKKVTDMMVELNGCKATDNYDRAKEIFVEAQNAGWVQVQDRALDIFPDFFDDSTISIGAPPE